MTWDNLKTEPNQRFHLTAFALEIQHTIRDDPELRLRIGIHTGDVVFEEDEVYGDGVNVDSRLETLAEPGGRGSNNGNHQIGSSAAAT